MSDTLYGIVNLTGTNLDKTTSGAGRLENFKTQIRDSAELGAQVVRIPGDWRMLEENGDDQWSQWYVDETVELIRYAGEKGISVIYGFAQTPEWAQSSSENSSLWIYPADPAQFAEAAGYLQAQIVAANVDQYVAAWEVWNEPNVTRYWPDADYRYPDLVAGGADIAVDEKAARQYIDLLNATYDALKSADPNVTVLGGAIAGTDYEYVEWMLKHSAKFDGLSLHPYTRNYVYDDPAPGQLDADVAAYPEGPGVSAGLNERWSFQYGIERIHDLLLENGRAGDIWITEVGWRLANDDTPWLYVPDQQAQAAYLGKALELVDAWDFVKAFTIFSLHDAPDGDFGLLNADGSWRPSAQAFHDFIGSQSQSAEFTQGNEKSNYLEGTGAADIILGYGGDDVIVGGAGDDVFYGGTGDDVLIGGTGNDAFVYQASGGTDYVRDFNAAEDIALIDYDGVESFADIQPLLQQWGPRMAICFDKENKLILELAELDELTAENFAFVGPEPAPHVDDGGVVPG